jgi:hypothetical protein
LINQFGGARPGLASAGEGFPAGSILAASADNGRWRISIAPALALAQLFSSSQSRRITAATD